MPRARARQLQGIHRLHPCLCHTSRPSSRPASLTAKAEALPRDLTAIGDVIASYSGGPTLSGVPAGGRSEGEEFENAVAQAFTIFSQNIRDVALVQGVVPARRGQPRAIKFQARNGPWAMYLGRLPATLDVDSTTEEEIPPDWVLDRYYVADLLESHLGPGPYPFAPRTEMDSAHYYGANYPNMFAGRTTNFDFAGALVVDGVLREKMLFEYKYAKSSNADSIDGNAHERLGFQVLQYLEIALRYPSCSLNVIAAQAFSEYRNKYHPAFNQQAARLGSTFQQVQWRYAANRTEYIALFECLARFLESGELPPVDYREAID